LNGRILIPKQSSSTALTVIVYAEALDGATVARPGHYKMAQRNKAFVPHVLAIPVGSKVDFPNADPIFHNVFSQSTPDPFNLGMYRTGQWRSHIFAQPATYLLFCKIHSQMAGLILVLPTSYITQTDSRDNYQLDLPPGRFKVTVWTERTRPVSSEVLISNSSKNIPDINLGPLIVEEISHSKN
jgi:plastocyanin